MDDHIERYHGKGLDEGAVFLTREKDQKEFKPCLSQTPWGRELR